MAGRSVSTIANLLDMSVSSLYRVFESEQMPLTQYIWLTRLELCCRVLTDISQKEKSVSQIAFEWRFMHSTYFSRIFTKQFGKL
ncbi:helix-turn-helix domain-containing protein [Serratia sp. M24T3]|uniref:helix-turn-helix domain-containing protein n=1 Tax=Serratia sp. M24T3 TaxID=932213 RepID=UPI000906E7D1